MSKVKKWPDGCDPGCQKFALRVLLASTTLVALFSLIIRYEYVHKISSETQTKTRKLNAYTSRQSFGELQGYNSTFYEDKNICGRQVCNIYYVKVHKTGSTTLQNILYRFGIARDLQFASFKCDNGMPYPNPAYSRFLYERNRVCNIMNDHAEFDNSTFREYMPNNTKIIFLLRHPFEFLQSTIAFHSLTKRFGLTNVDDVALTFLTRPESYDSRAKFIGSSTKCGPRRFPSYTQNAMSQHFGYKNQQENRPEIISDFLHTLNQTLDFVLILEKFDESLVLLKRQFRWQTRDIIYLPLWSLKYHFKKDIRVKRTNETTRQLLKLHRRWSTADYELYDFYHEQLLIKLTKMPDDYWQEVVLFQNIIKQICAFCASMCYENIRKAKGMTRDEVLNFLDNHRMTIQTNAYTEEFIVSYSDCISMSTGTLQYQNVIKARQFACASEKMLTAVPVMYCKQDHFLVNNIPWEVVRQSVFLLRDTCLRHFEYDCA